MNKHFASFSGYCARYRIQFPGGDVIQCRVNKVFNKADLSTLVTRASSLAQRSLKHGILPEVLAPQSIPSWNQIRDTHLSYMNSSVASDLTPVLDTLMK